MSDCENGHRVGMLLEPDAINILEGFGIRCAEHRVVGDADTAEQAAEELGFPVVIKVISPDVIHKSDVGGVVVGVTDGVAARVAVDRISERMSALSPEAQIAGYLVVRQAEPGHDVIVGGLRDKTFGSCVMFGMGGVFTELLGDVSFRVAPIAVAEARDMVSEIRAYPILSGARGGEAVEVDGLANILVRISRLMCERPDIVELDLNPVRATARGAIALDARIMVDRS